MVACFAAPTMMYIISIFFSGWLMGSLSRLSSGRLVCLAPFMGHVVMTHDYNDKYDDNRYNDDKV